MPSSFGTGYGFAREEIARTIARLLDARERQFERRDLVRAALDDYGGGAAGFADCLIGRLGLEAGCEATLTFDAGLRSNAGFQVL